jgi:PST family polysaccharide transporter
LLPVSLVAAIAAELISELLFEIDDYAWVVLLISVGLPLSMANTFVASVLNGQENYRRYIGLSLIAVVSASVAMLLLIVYAGLNGALAAAALSSSVAGGVMLAGSCRQPWFRLKYWWRQAGATQLKEIGSYVAMAITTAITSPLALIAVRNILVEQVGWEQAGYWQAVYKISEVYLGVVTIALGTYFLPKLSRLSGYESIRNEIASTAKVVMPVVAILALCVYLLRDFTIALLFTEAFREARDLFAVQMIGDVVKIFSWLYAYPMLSRGAVRWFIATEVIFSLSFIVFAYLLVGWYGVDGAVKAYTVNYILYFVIVYFNLRRFAC